LKKIDVCRCGSGLEREPLYDGHGIFLDYACDRCRDNVLSRFRPDIEDRYECDEPIDEDY
jgi:hypothetical protein